VRLLALALEGCSANEGEHAAEPAGCRRSRRAGLAPVRIGDVIPGPGPGQSDAIASRGVMPSGTLEDLWAPGRAGVTVCVSARSFEGRSDQIAAAREFVRQSLGSAPVLDEAVLLTSELCTNALQHTATGHDGTFSVAVVTGSCHARIAVRDDGSCQAPAAQLTDEGSERGRGLGLVELLADHWGHHGDHHGRTVFFELRWTPPPI
jgi:anti-sigma regulatory factor (Ser/Thr protein kinase)